MKKTVLFIAALAAAFLLLLPAAAADITHDAVFAPSDAALTDGAESTHSVYRAGSAIKIQSDEPIFAIYVKFDREPPEWTLSANGVSVRCGTDGFWHEFCDVRELCGAASEVELCFDTADAEICDIYVFSEGEIPDWVQRWEAADGYADLALFTTHADDEQLFFLGVLPYYAGELGYEVQVIYFTNHLNTRNRPHELLNGLWTVGVRRYPVIGELGDYWDGYNETPEYSYAAAAREGLTRDDLVAFQTRMLRRFRPQVVIGHDINGEYGHPQHKINTDTLMSALELSGDATYMPDDAAIYGIWDVPKTYLHLYGENRITMDWDKPLANFGGMTAYEVSKLGYACHLSQQYAWFTDWIKGKYDQYTKATDIRSYKPTEYGLYRSLVGIDTVGGDFFENITARSTLPPETEPPVETGTTQCEPVSTAEATTVLTQPIGTVRDSTLDITTQAAEKPEKKVPAFAAIGILSVLLCGVAGCLIYRSKNKK